MQNQLDLFTSDHLYIHNLRDTILGLEERALKDSKQLDLAHEVIKKINKLINGQTTTDWTPVTIAVYLREYKEKYIESPKIKPKTVGAW